MPTLDLWPEDIAVVEPMITPLSILKEQAKALGEKTKNILEVEVLSTHRPNPTKPYKPGYQFIQPESIFKLEDEFDDNEFTYMFTIVAPLLGNYNHELFRIQHNFIIYPVLIIFDKITLDENYLTKKGIGPQRKHLQASNEAEFKEILSEIFKAEYTRKIINALIAQSQSV